MSTQQAPKPIDFYYHIMGQEFGPVTGVQLRDRALDGDINQFTLVRVGDVQATMQMGQAFPNVWLRKSIEMEFAMTLAVGSVDASYRVEYLNYKEAAVTYKIK